MQELASKRNISTANATLKGGREEECVINSLDASYVLFKKVLQLFMTEVVAVPDGFFRPCSRHRVRPSYGDFLNSFAMKARAGPYGSYDNNNYCACAF